MAEREEYDEYPSVSAVTANASTLVAHATLPTAQKPVSNRERTLFVQMLPTRVQVKLNQPFGKDNIVQCFASEACLRHVYYRYTSWAI